MSDFDLYQAPQSNLELDRKPIYRQRQPIYWIAYFWLIGLLTVLAYLDPTDLKTPEDFAQCLFAFTMVVGLFGFVFQTPVISPWLWKIFCAFVVFQFCWYAGHEMMTTLASQQPMLTTATESAYFSDSLSYFLLCETILLPAYWAIFRYGFDCDALWHKNNP